MKRRALVFLGILLASFLCPPAFSTYENYEEKKSGGSGAGAQAAASMFYLVANQLAQSRAKQDEGQNAQAPAVAAPLIVTVAEFPMDLSLEGEVDAEIEIKRKSSGTVAVLQSPLFFAAAAEKKDVCCVLTSLTLANTWPDPVEIRVQGAGSKEIDPGMAETFEGEFGPCVRVTVLSLEPGGPNMLAEDVPVCCKDLKQNKIRKFYGIEIVSYRFKDVEGECPEEKEKKKTAPGGVMVGPQPKPAPGGVVVGKGTEPTGGVVVTGPSDQPKTGGGIGVGKGKTTGEGTGKEGGEKKENGKDGEEWRKPGGVVVSGGEGAGGGGAGTPPPGGSTPGGSSTPGGGGIYTFKEKCDCTCKRTESWRAHAPIDVAVVSPAAKDVLKVPLGSMVPLAANGADTDLVEVICQKTGFGTIEPGNPDCESCMSKLEIELPISVAYGWEIVSGGGSLVPRLRLPPPASRTAGGSATIYLAPDKMPADPTVMIQLTVDDTAPHSKNVDDAPLRREIGMLLVERGPSGPIPTDSKVPAPGGISPSPPTCSCYPVKTWEMNGEIRGGAPSLGEMKSRGEIAEEISGSMTVCADSYLVLSANASDTDTLKLQCRDKACPSDLVSFDQNDAILYQWEASAGEIIGTSEKVVYKAPPTPGKVQIYRHASDSGMQAPDGPYDFVPLTLEVFKVKVISTASPLIPGSPDNWIRYRVDTPPASAVRLEVYDHEGNLVRTISGLPTAQDPAKGYAEFKWDALDGAGAPLDEKKGPYLLRVVATKNRIDCKDEIEAGVCGEEDKAGILLEREDDAWIPKTHVSTGMKAKLYRWDEETGKWSEPACPRKITFEFVERSNEKGICMNWGEITSPDLFFDQEDANADFECSEDPSGEGFFGRCTTKEKETKKQITVKSMDYGSFGKVKASCKNCVSLKRNPEGAPVEDTGSGAGNVTIPEDDNDNQIADEYESRVLGGGQGAPRATDDLDEWPVGDRTKGDGLSAYEEYRGFLVQTNHKRTDWFFKDLFINDRTGNATVGVNRFSAASDLTVHLIERDEMGADRVINSSKGHANVVSQHGLIVEHCALAGGIRGESQHSAFRPRPPSGFWEQIFGVGRDILLGPPRNVTRVCFDPTKFADPNLPAFEETVPHELGHSVGMHHHGNATPIVDTIHPPQGFFGGWGGGRFHTAPTLCGRALPQRFLIGTKGDQGSGPVPCYMWYTNFLWVEVYPNPAGGYDCVPRAAPIRRTFFCSTKTGTAHNAGGQCGGDATYGNCRGQILVNDK